MTTQDRSEAKPPSESAAKQDPYARHDEGSLAVETLKQILAEESARKASEASAPQAPPAS
jgi:hypothetical protein